MANADFSQNQNPNPGGFDAGGKLPRGGTEDPKRPA